jgi:hypothetical protein
MVLCGARLLGRSLLLPTVPAPGYGPNRARGRWPARNLAKLTHGLPYGGLEAALALLALAAMWIVSRREMA